MKRWWWNVRYWWALLNITTSIRFCWQAALAADDAYDDGMTPADGVDAELEHWGD